MRSPATGDTLLYGVFVCVLLYDTVPRWDTNSKSQWKVNIDIHQTLRLVSSRPRLKNASACRIP